MTRFRLPWTLISAGIGILAVIIVPHCVKNYTLSPLTFIAIYTILVVGLNLLMGYAGQVSLGHAAFFGIGAYASAVLTMPPYTISPWLAMAIGMALSGVIALIVGIPSLRLHGHYLAVATLGFSVIVNIVMKEWSEITGGSSGINGIPKLVLGSVTFDSNAKRFYLAWAIAIIALVLAANLVNSRVGRALRAVHGSEAAASTLGVNVASYKIQVFVLSAMLAALAGSLYAHCMNSITPASFGFMKSVEFVVMVTIGGMASIWGAVIGAGTITMLGEWLRDMGSKYPKFAEFDVIIHGLILILVMLFMPSGIVCTIRDAIARLWRGRKPMTASPPTRVEEVVPK